MVFIDNTNSGKSIHDIYDKFNVKEKDVLDHFSVEFALYNHTSYGELAETIVLLKHKKNGLWYFVSGSECSVWDFKGQWEPEPYTPDMIKKMSETKERQELFNFISQKPDINYYTMSFEAKVVLYGHEISQKNLNKLAEENGFINDLLRCENKNDMISGGDLLPSNGSLAFNRPARLKFVHEEKDFSVVILEQTKDEQIKQFLIVVDPLLHETPLGSDGFYYATKDRYVAYLEEAYLANLPKTKPTPKIK